MTQMDRTELKQYLKDNLKMQMTYSKMSETLATQLILDGTVIAQTTVCIKN